MPPADPTASVMELVKSGAPYPTYVIFWFQARIVMRSLSCVDALRGAFGLVLKV